jgi:hypothetical protein
MVCSTPPGRGRTHHPRERGAPGCAPACGVACSPQMQIFLQLQGAIGDSPPSFRGGGGGGSYQPGKGIKPRSASPRLLLCVYVYGRCRCIATRTCKLLSRRTLLWSLLAATGSYWYFPSTNSPVSGS